ncbi:MAG: GNAT family N-acetyltransferase [Lewinella sp.]|nr:GNAT family N-acetyltransferase [Lewinella sp.]
MIRPYTHADEVAVLALLQLNIPRYFAPEEALELEDYLAREAAHYFVVEVDGQLIGAGGYNYFPEDRTARISWDFFHPDYHGQGWGGRLIDHRLNAIRTRTAARKIVVRTSQLAYRFYEKMGFTLTDTEKDYWAPGFDLYHMEMNLQADDESRP